MSVKKLTKSSDTRGELEEIYKGDNGQINLVTIKPGESRGGHSHYKTLETFILVKGDICYAHIENDMKIMRKGSALTVFPTWKHEFVNVTHEPVVLLVWRSGIYDKEEPDTY